MEKENYTEQYRGIIMLRKGQSDGKEMWFATVGNQLVSDGAFNTKDELIENLENITLERLCRIASAIFDRAIEILTKDADALSNEVEQLLSKTNTLMDDVNQKSKKVDPLFETVAQLSESVSDLNQASRQMAGKLSDSAQAMGNVTKVSTGLALAKGIWKFYSRNKEK